MVVGWSTSLLVNSFENFKEEEDDDWLVNLAVKLAVAFDGELGLVSQIVCHTGNCEL